MAPLETCRLACLLLYSLDFNIIEEYFSGHFLSLESCFHESPIGAGMAYRINWFITPGVISKISRSGHGGIGNTSKRANSVIWRSPGFIFGNSADRALWGLKSIIWFGNLYFIVRVPMGV